MALPHGAMGWSAVYDCAFPESYSLTFGIFSASLYINFFAFHKKVVRCVRKYNKEVQMKET